MGHKNKAERNAYQRRKYEENKENILAYNRKYKADNLTDKKYYDANRKEILNKKRKWRHAKKRCCLLPGDFKIEKDVDFYFVGTGPSPPRNYSKDKKYERPDGYWSTTERKQYKNNWYQENKKRIKKKNDKNRLALREYQNNYYQKKKLKKKAQETPERECVVK